MSNLAKQLIGEGGAGRLVRQAMRRAYRTSDGYTFYRERGPDGKYHWTDGDLSYPDKDGQIVDDDGVPLPRPGDPDY